MPNVVISAALGSDPVRLKIGNGEERLLRVGQSYPLTDAEYAAYTAALAALPKTRSEGTDVYSVRVDGSSGSGATLTASASSQEIAAYADRGTNVVCLFYDRGGHDRISMPLQTISGTGAAHRAVFSGGGYTITIKGTAVTIEDTPTAEDLAQAAEEALSAAEEATAAADAAVTSATGAAEAATAAAEAAEGALAEIDERIDAKADKQGVYPALVAGAAQTLSTTATTSRKIGFGPAGGSESIGNGVAEIKSIRGVTILFRQMLKLAGTSTNTDGVTITKNVSDGSVTVVTDQGGATADVSWSCNTHTAVAGHKYLVKGCPPGGSLSTYYLRDDVGYGSIFTAASSGNAGIVLHVKSGTVISSPIVFYPQLFDLTEIFGAGREPSAEEFTAIFPEPFYAYSDDARLLFAEGTEIRSIGFNAFDGTKARVVKSFDGTGQNHGYEINGTHGTVEFAKTADGERVTLTPESYVTEKGDTVQRILTPENGYVFISDAGADTCLHLIWSGNRSGANYDFKRHEATFVSIPDVIDGGLKEIGGVYDEITETQAVKRVGLVALSDLTWQRVASTVYSSDYFRTGAGSSSAKKIKIPSSGKANMTTTFIGTAATANDVGISVKYTSDENAGRITLRKPSGEGYASLDAFLADIAGHYLIYELGTPTETTLAEPLVTTYGVDDMGTEEVLAETVCAPCDVRVAYGVNAQDVITRLPMDYISKESFDGFCEALGEALGLTIVATYNSATGKYTYTITRTE